MTINIEWQDQNGNWHHYQSKQNQADAYQVGKIVLNQQKSATALWMTMGTCWI